MELSEKKRKPCLPGLPEVIIRIVVRGPYYFCKSHRDHEPSLRLGPGLSEFYGSALGGVAVYD